MIRLCAIALLVGLLGGFGVGWQVQGWRWRAQNAERVQEEQRAAWARAKAADRAAQGHEQDKAADRAEFRTIYSEVERVVETPVYRDRDCLDADGLRILGDAIAGRAAGAAREPAPAVRGAGRTD